LDGNISSLSRINSQIRTAKKKKKQRIDSWIRQFDIVVALFYVGLSSLESINLSFTPVTDIGMRKLSRLSSLKSLNIDAGQITDTGLAALTGEYLKGC